MLSRQFDVALSFAGKDRPVAYALADRLEAQGLTVFYDEWFGPRPAPAARRSRLQDLYLTAKLFVPIFSESDGGDLRAERESCAAFAHQVLQDPAWVLPVADEHLAFATAGETGANSSHRAEDAAAIIRHLDQRATFGRRRLLPDGESGAADGRPPVVAPFAATRPHRPIEITSYEIIHLMTEEVAVPASTYRIGIALEVRKYLRQEHALSLGWPYDIWRRNGCVFLSTLPNFSYPQQTVEFVLEQNPSVLRLKTVWIAKDSRFDKLDFHLWQPLVAIHTADRVVPCLEREVALRFLEQSGVTFGFPLTPGGNQPWKSCGWINELPPYDFMEWGRDPRLVAGRLGPARYILHEPSKIALYALLLVGRWSAPAFRALRRALAMNLPSRHHLSVLGQGRACIVVFLADTTRKDTGRAFVALRRTFAAVARMYAALRELPVRPADGCAALPALDIETASRFDRVCAEAANVDEIVVAGASDPGFEAAPFKMLSQTAEGRSLGFAEEPVLDLDPLVTHRDIVRFVQRHE